MTTSADLLTLAVAQLATPIATAPAIVYPTSAGADVFSPGDWPTQNQQYPIIKARVLREFKQSLGRGGGPQFLVTTTLRFVGEVSAPVQVRDAGAAAAQTKLWQLQREMEVAVIGSYPLERLIQQIAAIDSQLSYNSDAETHLAGIQMDVAMEFYQGPEDFAPIAADDLTGMAVNASNYPGAGFLADLQQ